MEREVPNFKLTFRVSDLESPVEVVATPGRHGEFSLFIDQRDHGHPLVTIEVHGRVEGDAIVVEVCDGMGQVLAQRRTIP